MSVLLRGETEERGKDLLTWGQRVFVPGQGFGRAVGIRNGRVYVEFDSGMTRSCRRWEVHACTPKPRRTEDGPGD